MTTERHVAVIRGIIDGFIGTGVATVLNELVAPEFTSRVAPVRSLATLRTAFLDLPYAFHHLTAADDEVVVWYRGEGANLGPSAGVSPAG